VISFDAVTVRYQSIPALSDLTEQIDSGE